jgi:hypothetical protein
LLAVALTCASSICAAAPQIEVQQPARNPIIGRPFPLKVIVTWEGKADDYSFLPLRLPEKDEIIVADSSMSSASSGGSNRVEYVVHLTAATNGEIEFGSVIVPYRVSGSDEEQSLESEPITFRVRVNPLALRILMCAVAAGSAVGIVRLVRSMVVSRRERGAEQKRIDQRDLAQELHRRLEEVKSLRISGDLGGYLMGLADIAAECGEDIRNSSSFKELKELADNTKFSGYQPGVEELDSSYRRVEERVKRFVDKNSAEAGTTSRTES